jgi:lipoyl(octanoyl) transferase
MVFKTTRIYMQQVILEDLGLIEYQAAWDYQKVLHQKLVATKLHNRNISEDHTDYQQPIHYLLFCEHPPVYTLGRSGDIANLLLNEVQLAQEGIAFFKTNRGGDITYHGPGQLVVYPIFDLDCFFTDVHRYVRYLEEIVIKTLGDYEVMATREKGYTGVWLPATQTQTKRKICAIGVHLSRWVTMHGLAFNIYPNLHHFQHIIPCGIEEKDKTVTSLAQELQIPIEMEAIKLKIKHYFAEVFQYAYTD